MGIYLILDSFAVQQALHLELEPMGKPGGEAMGDSTELQTQGSLTYTEFLSADTGGYKLQFLCLS